MPDLQRGLARPFLDDLATRIRQARAGQLDDLRESLRTLSVAEVYRELPDETLALAVQKSVYPEFAFEELFARRYLVRELPRWLAAWGATREQAEDIAHDLALRFWTSRLDAYEPTRSFGAYLYQAARHRWIDTQRRHARAPMHPLNFDLTTTTPGPLDEAIRAELIVRVRAALSRLTPIEARVIEAILDEQPLEEVAAQLHLTADQVYQVRFRARRHLERLLRVETQAARENLQK